MKRFITFLMVCVLSVTCALFVACDPAHTHDFGSSWLSDGDNHWHACSGCFEKSDVGEHDMLGEGQSCSVCGYSDAGAEVNENQWNVAVAIERFNNVTLKYAFTAPSGYTECEVLIAGDKVYRKNSNPVMNIGYIGEQAQVQKDGVLGLFVGYIADYQSFTYDAENGTYVLNKTITNTSTNPDSGMTSTAEVSNARIKFDSDYTIKSFTCDLTETISVGGNVVHQATYEDMVFEFSNFGTTVVDFATDVPYIPQNTYTQVSEEQWTSAMKIESDCEVKQSMTLMKSGEFYYVMEDLFIRSGNVIKFADWYISIVGDKYYMYSEDEDGWTKEECTEEDYIASATFRELIDAFDDVTFNSATGLYECDEVDLQDSYTVYSNFKAGFVDGKLVYVYYEDVMGSDKAVYQCYFTYKTVDVTLPTVSE